MTTQLIGKTLGGYKLEEIVGEGGQAIIYKAFQPSLKRWVAIKVLDADYEDVLIRFQREAETVARLRHPNILVVYEYGEEQGCPYIVMELVEQGTTLKNYLGDKPMDWAKAVRLIMPVAEALHYAHQQGLIHRDVKPSNILMPRPDWPLLADFSLVKVHTSQTITDIGVVMGTPAYIPPEQAGGEKVDHRADMYSLGVVMFEMITGRLPFDYENPHLLMMAHLSEPVPSPRQLNPACPPELEEIILTALRKDPEQRCPDVQIMINALRYVLNVSTTAFSSTTPTSPDKLDRPSDLGHVALSRGPTQGEEAAQIVLSAQNVTIDLPEPQQGSLIIGRTHRDTQVDIDLGPYGASEMGVSRQHARLTWQNGQWFIEDLGSLNGTYLNEVKLTPNTPASLNHGDLIRCSHLSFGFLISAEIRNEK